MPNLTGSAQIDVFALSMAASVSGILRGMGGIDTLDYSAYDGTRSAIVNLTTGTATAVAAGAANAVLNFENVTGGQGNDTLTGNTLNNILLGGAGNDTLLGSDGNDILMGDAGNDRLEGGAGADLLFGGDGLDTLLGQAGGDLLVGERTAFDANPVASQGVNTAALRAILAEWSTGRTYQQRSANISGTSSPTAQRSNGEWYLRRTSNTVGLATVFDDEFLDNLSGGDATGDWLYR